MVNILPYILLSSRAAQPTPAQLFAKMCSNEPERPPQLLGYGGGGSALKNILENPHPASPFGGLHTGVSPAALAEYQRLQLYDYAQAATRLRFAHPALVPSPYALAPFSQVTSDGQAAVSYGLSPFVRFDPRARFVQEEPKPQHSYIGLIAMAILSSPEKKMVLSDIYQYILDHYPYFRNRGPGWRNSIRHNLSLNDCFIKAGRSANGKGHYWAIHPANIEDFKKGDFRRRKAQRKVRKHMGLSVPDDDDSPGPTPPPAELDSVLSSGRENEQKAIQGQDRHLVDSREGPISTSIKITPISRKRLFDMESLLAPDPVRADIIAEGSSSPPLEIDGEGTAAESSRSIRISPDVEPEGMPREDTLGSLILTPEEDSIQREKNTEDVDKSRLLIDQHNDLLSHMNLTTAEYPVKSSSLRPIVQSSAVRRAVQWTMSLPLQNVNLNPRIPFGSVATLPFSVSTPCWSPAQAASLLSYTVTAGSSAVNRSSELPTNVGSPCTAITNLSNPLVHRWQETINRVMVGSETGHKVFNH